MDKKKLIGTIIGVLLFIALMAGATYAWLNGRLNNSGTIHGSTYQFKVSLGLTPVKTGHLIPVTDSIMLTSLNSATPCVDGRGYGYSLCSIYQVNLSNTGEAINLYGYLKTITGTTYTTSNLRYQLFTHSSSYTAVSDASVLSSTANSKNYLTLNSSNMNFSLTDGSTTPSSQQYFLVIWLHDINDNQLDDSNKSYTGDLVFETLSGGSISASFST